MKHYFYLLDIHLCNKRVVIFTKTVNITDSFAHDTPFHCKICRFHNLLADFVASCCCENNSQLFFFISQTSNNVTVWNCPYSELFWSVNSPNTGKYGPEYLWIRTLFTQCAPFVTTFLICTIHLRFQQVYVCMYVCNIYL